MSIFCSWFSRNASLKEASLRAIRTFCLIGCAYLTGSNAIAQTAEPDDVFESIMRKHWAAKLEQSPEFATSLGVREYDHILSDPSLAAFEASVSLAKTFEQSLNEIPVTRLSEANQLNHALLLLDLRNDIEAANHGGKYLIMNNRSGPHLNLTSMVGRLPFFKLSDYKSYLQRLALMPEYLQRATNRIRTGLSAGWVQACAPMKGFEQSIETHIVNDVQSSVFYTPFKQRPSVIGEADFNKMSDEAKLLIRDALMPSLRAFLDFYLSEYRPKCRTNVGVDGIPGGKEFYDYRVAFYTTSNSSADEIHARGLSEVKRIKSEMLEVIKEAEFEGSFDEWLIYLRDNSEFYPKSAKERMQVAAAISKKMDGELPKLFGKLPRMPYGLKEIPKDIAEKTTTAYYSRPAGDGSRAGFYWLNTSLLDTRPLYQLEALSLHEAVPGHHLQLALAQELDLPDFRKYGGQTVFVEGWGLYAERLGLEAGFYQTPYTNFGRLSYEMWRACRLVVDTGLHSKGWTRQQAIDYMAANSGLSMNNVTSEVDRYISWPAQALAYKTGELKIRELRAKSEAQLGSDFDIREFHDKILENGALPLSVLERIIDQWLKDKKQG